MSILHPSSPYEKGVAINDYYVPKVYLFQIGKLPIFLDSTRGLLAKEAHARGFITLEFRG